MSVVINAVGDVPEKLSVAVSVEVTSDIPSTSSWARFMELVASDIDPTEGRVLGGLPMPSQASSAGFLGFFEKTKGHSEEVTRLISGEDYKRVASVDRDEMDKLLSLALKKSNIPPGRVTFSVRPKVGLVGRSLGEFSPNDSKTRANRAASSVKESADELADKASKGLRKALGSIIPFLPIAAIVLLARSEK